MPRFTVWMTRLIETTYVIEAATLAEARKLASAMADLDITQAEIEDGGNARVESVKRIRRKIGGRHEPQTE